MFTGIIEHIGTIINVEEQGSGKVLKVESPISSQLHVDQSINHNGVCLTVTDVQADVHSVVAISETLQRSNLKSLKVGDNINLERSMKNNGRFDGHIVQGHVDQTAHCNEIVELDGSWEMDFELAEDHHGLLIEKGSVCLNGISLTCFGIKASSFRVAIIPYTFDNTNLGNLGEGGHVNVEFDVVGKYIQSLTQQGL